MHKVLRERGFTLLEILLVLAILGLLVTLAVVTYQAQLLGARRGLGVAELNVLRARQEQYRLRYGRYATELQALGHSDAAYGIDSRGSYVDVVDDERVYVFNLSTLGSGFVLSATPQLRQRSDAMCGELRLSWLGTRSASGDGGVVRCW